MRLLDLRRWPRRSTPSARGLWQGGGAGQLADGILGRCPVVWSGGEVQPFGIVVLDPAIWHLARIERQLWCVDGQEFGFYCAVANRGVEDRGTPLDTGITAGSAGLTFAAGANSYFHAPRSERVPDRHQWIAGSLRPRTWMPAAALNLLAEYSRPKQFCWTWRCGGQQP